MFDWFCFVVVCGVRLFFLFFFLEKCILVILRNEVRSLCPILLMGKRQKKKRRFRGISFTKGLKNPIGIKCVALGQRSSGTGRSVWGSVWVKCVLPTA